MKGLKKMGGIAALYEAASYILGMGLFLLVMDYTEISTPGEKLAFMMENQITLYLTNLLIYVVFGLFLVVLALALHDRLKSGAAAIIQAGTAVGLIWACLLIASGMVSNLGIETVASLYDHDPTQAATVWLTVDTVALGLGGVAEIVGGVWMLLVSWAALRTGTFPKALNYLGLLVGGVGVLTAIPPLKVLGPIFGLIQIVWFVWLGIILLRQSTSAAQEPETLVPQYRATS